MVDRMVGCQVMEVVNVTCYIMTRLLLRWCKTMSSLKHQFFNLCCLDCHGLKRIRLRILTQCMNKTYFGFLFVAISICKYVVYVVFMKREKFFQFRYLIWCYSGLCSRTSESDIKVQDFNRFQVERIAGFLHKAVWGYPSIANNSWFIKKIINNIKT